MHGLALLRMHTWMSASFPIGAFSYSHGLEAAISRRLVTDRSSCEDWLSDLLRHGSAHNDALLFAASWRSAQLDDDEAISLHNDLAVALASGCERRLETCRQGEAFCSAMKGWHLSASLDSVRPEVALPIAVGVFANEEGAPLVDALSIYLQATMSNLVWIAARLIPLGQTDALAIIAAQEQHVLRAADEGATGTLDDLGSCSLVSDLASLHHEQLDTRICQT